MKKAKILIVEDETIIAMEIEASLKSLGYEVSSIVDTGAKAIARAEVEKPDIILMDIRIKGQMDGIEAAEIIRSRFGIPVIFSTAYLDEERIERAKIVMPFGYILKPIRERDLKVTIEMATYVVKFNAERRQAEEKVDHLNRVLRAIRNVNKIIVTEKDADRLIKSACDNLIETRGYFNAWIALFDKDGTLKATAEAGLGDDFLPLIEQLNRGKLTGCAQKVLEKPGVVAFQNPAVSCTDCPLSKKYADRGAMVVQLGHGGATYGLLAVSIPASLAVDKKEQELSQEVAGDLAFALYNIYAEERLNRLEQIITTIPQPMSFVSRDYRYLAVNTAYSDFYSTTLEQILGYSVADFVGQSIFEANIKPYLDRCLAGEDVSYEIQVDLPVKGKRWMGMQHFPHQDKSGEITGVVSHGIDITDRKLAEEALEQSEEKYRELAQSSNSIITKIDQDYNFTFINQYALDFFGYTEAELMGKSSIETIVPEVESTGRNLKKNIEDILNNPEAFTDNENENIRKNGERVWVAWRNSGIYDGKGKLSGLLSTGYDITKRKKAEKALRESEKKYQDLYDNAPDMHVSVDTKTALIINCNQTVVNMTGFNKEELIGRSIFDMYTPESADYAKTNVFPEFLKTGKIAGEELQLKRKDGSIFDVSLNVSAIYDSGGDIISSRSSWRDITEKKRIDRERLELERQLLQGQKMESLGTLASGIAHDFNNLLFQILGFTQLTKKKLKENTEAVNLLKPIEAATHRAADLVKQILTFSRSAGSELKPVVVQPIIKEILKLLRASLPATIEIRQNINPQCGFVLADLTKIYQVVMNLCTNAYQAMWETGGILEVTLGEIKIDSEDSTFDFNLKPGGYLELKISDTGHGMDKKTLKSIFSPFFTTKSDVDGTGLGLPTVKRIVDEHRGSVSVSSKPGKGTTFNVFLPKTDIVELKPIVSVNKELKGGTEKIIIVDDEHSSVAMLKGILEELGYKIAGFNNGFDALKAFRANPKMVDLVITDQTMSGMTGAEMAVGMQKIRSDIPIILMTGYSSIINEEEAISMGIRKFLLKPVDIIKMADTIREVLDG